MHRRRACNRRRPVTELPPKMETAPTSGRADHERPTIADVAQRAGVAISTVSRVLNDGQVSSPTQTRVLAAMTDLGYRPDRRARALASGVNEALGLVIPFFTRPASVERLRGALEAMQTTEHELLLCNVATPAQRDEYLGRRAPLDRVDGLLIVSLAPRDDEVEAIARAGMPAVLVDADHPRLPRIVTDDVRGGELATEHLLELGHRRIGFVGDTTDPGFGFVSSDRRRTGWRNALRRAELPEPRALSRVGSHGRSTAHRLTRELLSLDQPPTAIFAASDTQALGVLEAAWAEGFKVPEDLSLIGYDDLEVAPYVGLTTVSQSLHESGRLGVQRLLELLTEGGRSEPLEERLPLTLQVRSTTGPPR
jgi:LacI family transcriptional regulator